MRRLSDFLHDDAGNVTIDWVAMTAGILLLGITVAYAIFNSGVSALAGDMNENLAGITIVDPGAAPSFGAEPADDREPPGHCGDVSCGN